MAYITFTYLDYSDEQSTITFQATEPAADGSDLQAIELLLEDIDAAIEDLTLCKNIREAFTISVLEADLVVSDENAQRESGMRVFCKDAVNARKFHFTIPGPDKSIVAQQGTDKIDLTVTEVAAMVTAVEAGALSPYGNAFTVKSAKLVGRNN